MECSKGAEINCIKKRVLKLKNRVYTDCTMGCVPTIYTVKPLRYGPLRYGHLAPSTGQLICSILRWHCRNCGQYSGCGLLQPMYYSEIWTKLSYGHPLIPRRPDKRGLTVPGSRGFYRNLATFKTSIIGHALRMPYMKINICMEF